MPSDPNKGPSLGGGTYIFDSLLFYIYNTITLMKPYSKDVATDFAMLFPTAFAMSVT